MKNEIKPLVDELEQKINTANEDIFNPEEIRRKNIERQQQKDKKQRKPAVLNKGQDKTKSERKKGPVRRNRMRSEDDFEDE